MSIVDDKDNSLITLDNLSNLTLKAVESYKFRHSGNCCFRVDYKIQFDNQHNLFHVQYLPRFMKE